MAKKAKAASGTITSPEAQLLPENLLASLPKAWRFDSLSGNRIMMFIGDTLPSAFVISKLWRSCFEA